MANLKKAKVKNNSRKKIKRFIFVLWTIVIILTISLSLYFILLSNGFLGKMPDFEQLENPDQNLATEIYTSDLKLIGTYFLENRTKISYLDISPNVINALIATEDIRFQEHSGIDFRAISRVITGIVGKSKGGGSTISQQLAKMLFPRKDKMSKAEMVNRKFKEWVIAVKLERNYTKEEIIEMYLNKFDFLNLAVGIESASRVYFDTIPKDLSMTQAAMLVGMAKNPSLYNPLKRPEQTQKRRNVVLSQMLKYDYIEQSEFDSLKLEPLGLRYNKVDHNIGSATYFREFLRLWLSAKKPIESNYIDKREYVEDSINWHTDPSYGWCNKNINPQGEKYNIYEDGLKIYTSIDSRMQKYAEDAVNEHIGQFIQPAFFKDQKNNKRSPFASDMTNKQIENLMLASMKRTERWRHLKSEGISEDSIISSFNSPQEMTVFSWNGDIDTIMSPKDSIIYYKRFLRAGFMAMEPSNGHVKAYVGGINYKHMKFDQVTKSRRQVGSTIKPLIYCLAMQNGYSPCTRVPNIEVTFKLPKGSDPEYYTPKYSKSKLDGEVINLKTGLANSLNQISAWVLKQFSPEAAVSLAQKLGIHSHIDPYPSICVGAPEVLLSEMLSSYCTFANKGIAIRPLYITRIEDKTGKVIASFTASQNEAISEETAFLMTDLMKGVVDMGTARRLRYKYNLKGELAGKTGTTNRNSDGWYIGISPELVAGAWVGGEERSIRFRYMDYGQGAVLALPIYGLFMQKVYSDSKLPYSEDAKFEKPEHISVEVNCNEYNNDQEDQDFNNL